MKKILLTIGIILISMTGIGSASPKTEKLIFDDTDWDYNPRTSQLEIPLLSSFGIARAGERAGFTVNVFVEIYNLDGSLAGVGEGSGEIQIIGDSRTAKQYVRIAPVYADVPAADWNGDDDGSSIITGWIEVETSKEKLIHKTSAEGMKIFDLFPKLPGIWGRLANPGFHNQKIKTTLFFSGQAKDGSQFYECNPGLNIGLFTVYPIDPHHLNWSANPTNRDFALGSMVAAGLNTVSMSSWGEDFLPCTTAWAISAPMQTAPGSHDELFEAAGNHDLVIIPFIESRGDWAFRHEFPTTIEGDVAPGTVSQIVNLIERYLQNPEHPEWASRWAVVWDQSRQPRYAVTLIHASSDRITPTAHASYAQGFDLIADEVFNQTGVRVGFFIDPLPPNSNAPGVYKPSPEGAGPELLKTDSILGIQSFIPEIWLPGGPTDMQLLGYKDDYSQRWSQTGVPFLMDVSPGYDAHLVFPGSIYYGFTLQWQNVLTEMVKLYGEDGLVFNSWNGYTEGMAAVPTMQHGNQYFYWLQTLTTIVQ